MAESTPTSALIEEELQHPAPIPKTLPMGTKLFTLTQGPEDLERLRQVYEVTAPVTEK